MRCVSYARAHVSLATTLETGPEKARYREVQRLVRSHTAGGWGGQGLHLGRAPRKCQPFATALTAHESAVTWKLHLDKGRSQQGDGKWGGCAVAGDGDGKADVWHHHAAGPRRWRTYIDCLARMQQDGVQTGSGTRLSCSTGWECGGEGSL